MAMALPVLVLTPGEPAGIGPDLCVQLASRVAGFRAVFLADPDLLRQRAAQLGLPFAAAEWRGRETQAAVSVLPLSLVQPAVAGRLDARNAPYVMDTLARAVQGCRDGEFDALVTGPVHKGIINDAGIPFTGHTEFLAQQAGVNQVVMMLAGEGLRVALATTHLPLADVAAHITRAHLKTVLTILHRDLVEKFAIPNPVILVCGLNPHAGESGHLGREEIETIAPVIAELTAHGMQLRGPVPADTAFTPRALAGVDAVLAMYHDQGLPVLKYRAFGHAVNITLGLPFIRTSVDHGTALELAGTGRIDSGSLDAAIAAALEMIRARALR